MPELKKMGHARRTAPDKESVAGRVAGCYLRRHRNAQVRAAEESAHPDYSGKIWLHNRRLHHEIERGGKGE